MIVATSRSPIRRSPIHAIHESLGAHWPASGALWPSAYGDPAAERATSRSAAVIVDVGPLDKYSVKAASAARVLAPLGLPFAATELLPGGPGGSTFDVWGVAPDEALLIGAAPTAPPTVPNAIVTDLSSGLSALALVGPRSRSILEELTSLDVADRAFVDRAIASAPLANVRVIIARHDLVGRTRFVILVDRDLAEYVWASTLAVGARHGLQPGGAMVLAD